MKEKGKYNNIEELYRAGLGEREFPVSEGFWQVFARKLRFREFMQFKPGSFNVYYLAGFVAATAITIAVITTAERSEKPEPDIVLQNDTLAVETIDQGSDESPVAETKQAKKEEVRPLEKAVVPEEQKQDEAKVTDTEPEKERAGKKKEKSSGLKTIAGRERVTAEAMVQAAPVAKFTTDTDEGCAPLTISFNNLSFNYDSCMWEFDDGGVSTEDDPVWVFDEEGNYEVNLLLFGEDGSTVVTRKIINVYPRPVARFEVNAGNPHIPDEEVLFYNYSQNSVEWEWEFGDGTESNEFEPTHFYDKPGSYTVKLRAVSEHGCADSMVITNAFGENSCFIRFPNAFVPNEGGPTGGYYSNRSDEQEEVFHPVYSGVTSYNLRIYSRRGILMFETDDIDIGWDGYYKGQKAEPGVYIWKVRGVYKNGEPFVKGGDLTLLPKW